MSFSTDTKEELSKINNWSNKELLRAELNGYRLSSNTEIKLDNIAFTTENIDTIERYNKILDNLNINYKTEKKGKLYYTEYIKKDELSDINIDNKEVLRAVLRGVFFASGTLNNPNNKYHLEIFLSTKENAKYVNYITEQFHINSKMLDRKKNYSVYIKDGENISNFLALIGANKSVLNFEEMRVIRQMKNNINRVVNCETANLSKIINVAISQIEDIKYIMSKNKFEELPSNLKEMAKIRLENPDVSFVQMGKMLENPIGKSGVNHRLKKISEIADELRKEENI